MNEKQKDALLAWVAKIEAELFLFDILDESETEQMKALREAFAEAEPENTRTDPAKEALVEALKWGLENWGMGYPERMRAARRRYEEEKHG